MARMKLKKRSRPPRANILRKLGSSGGKKKLHIKRLKPRRKRTKSRKGFKLLTGGPVGKV